MLTLQAWHGAQHEDQQEAHITRVGLYLQRTTDTLCAKFKLVSDWERDQSVHVLGIGYRSVPSTALRSALNRVVSSSSGRAVYTLENRALMAVVTEAEVVRAIRALSRQKALGTDGLGNDFYKDLQSLLVPPLVGIANEITNGAQPPRSFMEALIIPLRKKGDSDDVMDCRPIFLLQARYKVIAKVLATRMQLCPPHVIGASQQGFVHDRQVQKTVSMMLAHLQTTRDDSTLDADASRAVTYRTSGRPMIRSIAILWWRRFGYLDLLSRFSRSFNGFIPIRQLDFRLTVAFLLYGRFARVFARAVL